MFKNIYLGVQGVFRINVKRGIVFRIQPLSIIKPWSTPICNKTLQGYRVFQNKCIVRGAGLHEYIFVIFTFV